MTIDFTQARAKMVDNQIRTMDVTSHAVLDAFAAVPREMFLPAELRPLAYIDQDIEIVPAKNGRPARHVVEPAQLARLVQLAGIGAGDVVLEIGAGTGYLSAVLSRIAGSVVALECDEALADQASSTLPRLGCDNVAVVTGELAKGWAAEAPYDAIIFSGAIDLLPHALLDQLRDGGRLVVVEGAGNAARAKLYIRDGADTSQRSAFNSAIKPLPGFTRETNFRF